MKITKIKFVLAALTVLVIKPNTYAQIGVYDIIADAEMSYLEGDFYESLKLLSVIDYNEISNDAKIDFFRLKSICFLMNGNLDSSKKYCSNLLKSNPYYKDFPEIDPLDFTNLLNQFVVLRDLSISLRLGGNFSLVNVIENKNVFDDANKQYNTVLDQDIVFSFEKLIANKYPLKFSLGYTSLSYRQEVDNYLGWNQKIKERVNRLNFGLMFNKSLINNRVFDLNVGLGATWNRALNHSFTVLTNSKDGNQFLASQEIKDLRKSNLFGLQFELGQFFRIQQKRNESIGLVFGTRIFPTSIMNSEKTTSDKIAMDNLFMSDEISVNQFYFGFEYRKIIKQKVKPR